MSPSPGSPDEPRWIVEPPGADEIQIYLSVGDGIEVTEEVELALDRLFASFETEEVEGYWKCYPQCPDLKACGTYLCTLKNCMDLVKNPCKADVRCEIKRTLF